MTWELVLRQGVLFAHLVAFAIAISAVLREDWMLISTRRIAWHRLLATARALTISLVALWATGGALVALDVGLSFAAIGANAKLTAKVLVVLALTVNGFALHAIAFPMIRRAHRTGRKPPMTVPFLLGAVSTASWLYASFVGVARLIAPSMTVSGFMAGYVLLVISSIAVALMLSRLRSFDIGVSCNPGGGALRSTN